MAKLSNMIENLKARQEAMTSESAFSLIDVVVTVAIVVALSVGGFIAYSGIVENAKAAATGAAADQVYTALLVAENDGFAGNTGFTSNADSVADIVDAYTASTEDIDIHVSGSGATLSVYASHADTGITNYPDAVDAEADGESLVKYRGMAGTPSTP